MQCEIRAYISKDGSRRHSQVSSVKLTISSTSEQEALEVAKEIIIQETGQTVLDVWIPVVTANAVLDALDSIYTDENWGNRDLGKWE